MRPLKMQPLKGAAFLCCGLKRRVGKALVISRQKKHGCVMENKRRIKGARHIIFVGTSRVCHSTGFGLSLHDASIFPYQIYILCYICRHSKKPGGAGKVGAESAGYLDR